MSCEKSRETARKRVFVGIALVRNVAVASPTHSSECLLYVRPIQSTTRNIGFQGKWFAQCTFTDGMVDNSGGFDQLGSNFSPFFF